VVRPCETSVRPLILPTTGIPFGVQLFCAPIRNVAPAISDGERLADAPLDCRVDQTHNVRRQDDRLSVPDPNQPLLSAPGMRHTVQLNAEYLFIALFYCLLVKGVASEEECINAPDSDWRQWRVSFRFKAVR
jgi:hypothetical protein